MIAELEQCSCGILFIAPISGDVEFAEHLRSGLHQRCLEIEICGPCFMGGCTSCEKRRFMGPQIWRCRCAHTGMSRKRKFAPRRLDEISHDWSTWLAHGAQSGYSLGME